ncbi:uncharacterized protein [Diadema setosum]|uniref:uncharacterized protein n=1 Tax=Diadema setosum TaxID=31175 RepID=UPI003B3A4A92
MSEESARKRPRLSEDDTDNLSKADLLDYVKKQDLYIADLETRLETSGPSNSGDGEDKARHLKAARREQLLVMRLTTKEQELHELANQLADKTQNAGTAQLRSAMVDPALNLLIQRLKRELEDKNTKLKQAHEDMAAWKFTQDSQTGKRLMARCRTLIQENQELGKQVSQGKVSQVEAELALQKEINEELKSSQDEMYEMVIQLNDEGEGMQSTILALQQDLKEKQQEIARLKSQGEPTNALETPAISEEAKKEAEPCPTAAHEPRTPVTHEPENDVDMEGETSVKEEVEEEHQSPEPMEQGEATEQDQEEPASPGQIPAVRTTEYSQEALASPTRGEAESTTVPATCADKDSLSVEPWTNPSHFVASPASPVEEVDERTSEGDRVADVEFRTELPPQEELASESRDAGQYAEEEVPSERTSESTLKNQGAESISDEEEVDSTSFRDEPEEREERGSDVGEEQPQFRTPLDDSSQDSTICGDVRDAETDDSSRIGERSGTLTPDFSTNGEHHRESAADSAAKNGEAEPLYVNNDDGREGESVERSIENERNTLVQDPSTYEAVEDEVNSLDNGSDITDRQSEEVATDNNNGVSNSGEYVNSGVSSPREDAEVPRVPAGEHSRTDSVVKSLSTNCHDESPTLDEGVDSEQCGDEDSTIQNSVPSTNSNPDEISV